MNQSRLFFKLACQETRAIIKEDAIDIFKLMLSDAECIPDEELEQLAELYAVNLLLFQVGKARDLNGDVEIYLDDEDLS